MQQSRDSARVHALNLHFFFPPGWPGACWGQGWGRLQDVGSAGTGELAKELFPQAPPHPPPPHTGATSGGSESPATQLCLGWPASLGGLQNCTLSSH